jgi:hypothetical protein
LRGIGKLGFLCREQFHAEHGMLSGRKIGRDESVDRGMVRPGEQDQAARILGEIKLTMQGAVRGVK